MGSVALETPKGRWRRSGGSSVSTVLTSPPLRRRTPKTNCGIPRILEERFDGRLGDVSAVDTGLPAGSWWRSRVSFTPAPARLPLPGPFWLPCRSPEAVVRRRLRTTPTRPTPRGRGSTGRGLCVLHECPTYLEYPRPSFSSTPPSWSRTPQGPQAPDVVERTRRRDRQTLGPALLSRSAGPSA